MQLIKLIFLKETFEDKLKLLYKKIFSFERKPLIKEGEDLRTFDPVKEEDKYKLYSESGFNKQKPSPIIKSSLSDVK